MALAVTAAMAVGLHSDRQLDWAIAIPLLVAYAVAKRIRFAVGAGHTVPTQLVFVPMLFLLPTPAVPMIVVAGIVLGNVPDYITRRTHLDRLLLAPGDALYAVPPALVLTLSGVEGPARGHAAVFLAALAAQLLFDPIWSTLREWLALGVSPRLQPSLLGWVLLVDALLAPVGLMAARVGWYSSGGWLLVVPLLGLIAVFASERQERIENALELGRAYRGTTLLLSDVLEADDHYTGSHSWGVVALALKVADGMGLDSTRRRNVEFGALLHDIGKIAIPKEIINRPGPLSDEEWILMKRHTLEGERMLRRVGGVLGDVGAIVRSSHERWDGAGYPDGLAGDDIPIEACIVCCCDAFDAMTTDRPYRTAMATEQAIGELKLNAGTQFHPRVVEVLTSLLAEAGEPLAARSACEELRGHALAPAATAESLSHARPAAP
jgi:putative nucleotidyltransferase with HDIG domain